MKPFLFSFLIFSFLAFAISATTFSFDFSQMNNTIIYLNPSDSIFDNFSNNSIIPNYNTSKADIFVQLQYSKCIGLSGLTRNYCEQIASNQPILNYTNQTLNITILAPNFPYINKLILLNDSNSNFYDLDYNLTVIANLTCNYSNNPNQTVYLQPNYPVRMINLGFNETFTNSTFNLTITSPSKPKVNQRMELQPTQVWFNDEFNFTAVCTKENFVCEPQVVEKKVETLCPVCEQTPINDTTCEGVLNDKADEIASAKLAEIAKFGGINENFCYRVQDDNKTRCNSTILIDNQTPICIDTLTDICTIDEIKKGNWRSCFERFVNSQKSEVVSLMAQVASKDKDIADLNERIKSLTDNSQFVKDMFVIGAWVLFGALAIYAFFRIFGGRQVFKMEVEPTKPSDKLTEDVTNNILKKLIK